MVFLHGWQELQALGPFSIAFSNALAGNWCFSIECKQQKQQLNVLCHNIGRIEKLHLFHRNSDNPLWMLTFLSLVQIAILSLQFQGSSGKFTNIPRCSIILTLNSSPLWGMSFSWSPHLRAWNGTWIPLSKAVYTCPWSLVFPNLSTFNHKILFHFHFSFS